MSLHVDCFTSYGCHELQAAPTLEALKAISVASQLIGNLKDESTLDDPLADRYAKLGCQITPLDHDSEDYKMISNYLAKTIAPVKFMDSVFNNSMLVLTFLHMKTI